MPLKIGVFLRALLIKRPTMWTVLSQLPLLLQYLLVHSLNLNREGGDQVDVVAGKGHN